MSTAVVVDSTAQLSAARRAELEAALGGLFRVVDLSVEVGEETRADGEWSPDELCEHMRAGARVQTSMPSAQAFSTALGELAAAGAAEVLVLTLPAVLSGTHGSAVAAAAEHPALTVHLVDSRTTSAGLAGAVAIAVAGIASGLPPAAVAGEVADWCEAETRTFFVPEDLEYLRRGGRIGRAASLLGRALAITPVLGLRDGAVVPLARVRTMAKAEDRLVALVAESCAEYRERAADAALEVVLLHPESTPETAGAGVRRMQEKLAAADLPAGTVVRTEVLSTVITAHVGPGALGVAVQTRP